MMRRTEVKTRRYLELEVLNDNCDGKCGGARQWKPPTNTSSLAQVSVCPSRETLRQILSFYSAPFVVFIEQSDTKEKTIFL